MSIKYKIDDTKKNKNLINDEIKLSRVKSNGGPSDGGIIPGSKNKITLAKLAEQMADLTKKVKDGFAEQAKFNKSIREDLNRVIKLNNLKH